MDWSEDHDVVLLREIRVSELFSHKKGTVGRGDVWDKIVEQLNTIDCPKFHIKDKRSVRDRWKLLQKKFSQRMRQEEAASGIQVDELSEKDILIEELIEMESSSTTTSKSIKEKDKETAENMRKMAMERMGETKRRSSKESDNSDGKSPTAPAKAPKKRRAQTQLIDFLEGKAQADRVDREAELELKKKEQQNQQDLIRSMMQQQQQTTTAFMAVLQKLLEK